MNMFAWLQNRCHGDLIMHNSYTPNTRLVLKFHALLEVCGLVYYSTDEYTMYDRLKANKKLQTMMMTTV